MSDKTERQKTDPNDLPPIKNIFVYAYRIFVKCFSFAFFGVGSVVLAIIVFPVLRLCVHPKEKFQKTARATVSASFRFFLRLLSVLGVARLSVNDRKAFRELRSKIIVANHPSLLDVVFIISLVPNADCVVRGGLSRTILAGVIRQLYIVNTLGYDQMIELSKKSLATGTNLIVFPEGTRTPRRGTNKYKKGAARIAYETKSDVAAVYIGGNDKYGLGKKEKLLSYNRSEIYRYDIHFLGQIKIGDYEALEPQIAAKRLTEAMHTKIAEAARRIDGRTV